MPRASRGTLIVIDTRAAHALRIYPALIDIVPPIAGLQKASVIRNTILEDV